MGGILQTMTHQRHPKALDGFADDSIFGHTSIFPHHEPFAHKMKFLMGVAWQAAMGKEVLVLLAPPGKCNQRIESKASTFRWMVVFVYPHTYFSGFGLKGTFTTLVSWLPGESL